MRVISFSVILSLFLVSCSIHKSLLGPEGVARVKIEQKTYDKPEFFLTDLDLQKVYADHSIKKNNRLPASANQNIKKSNRQLYFLSLYHQYLTMGKVLGFKSEVSSCPSFHQLILENEAVKETQTQFYSTDIELGLLKHNSAAVPYNPVLAIPFTQRMDLYTALEEDNWGNPKKLLNKSLVGFYKRSENEVKQLCDTGVSPGHYIFENMVTYFKEKRTFKNSRDALSALVKIPVLANMMILDNLTGPKRHKEYRSVSTYDKWLLSRSNAIWFEKYISLIKSKRIEAYANAMGKSKHTVLTLNR